MEMRLRRRKNQFLLTCNLFRKVAKEIELIIGNSYPITGARVIDYKDRVIDSKTCGMDSISLNRFCEARNPLHEACNRFHSAITHLLSIVGVTCSKGKLEQLVCGHCEPGYRGGAIDKLSLKLSN
ncbi:hypothetical protein LR48_Vigan03g027600 [Vigna angularis]|uniref:Uncharacterized protein n=1 Tax=Phaseolus angularis TaxID=3914 RepID=A0A0L9U285_PHAAN|nr:hypothetical protein LR48_Vigan03g027600 [Vigna angularis]